jgi:uncharacterized protein (TIGR00369 family)
MHASDFSAVAEAVRDALNQQGFLHHMGAEIDDVAPGKVVMSLPKRPQLLQQHGFFHGGAVAFLIDNATTAAAGTLLNRDQQTCLTAEYKLNILSPANGERLTCTANVVKPGKRLTVVEAKVHSISGADMKLVAVALATIANLDRAGLPA